MKDTAAESVVRECPNCGETFTTPPKSKLAFCDDLCREFGKHIRWFRGRADREVAFLDWLRSEHPVYVQRRAALVSVEGFQMPDADIVRVAADRIATLLSGGYGERARRIPQRVRDAVTARDGGRCVQCGEPGVEIDHKDGPDYALENLQLLCRACHRVKTDAAMVPAILSEDKVALLNVLARRVISPRPLAPCDDSDWTKTWRSWVRDHEVATS